ncbi:hypothetical protein TPHA_0F02490 [Tetrapisispora phaffii CBS 4417]|uniref:DAGKc domain-containing protein n=1 Tax=Tetrapisispora phaffii (strain ATCC 24235 / CBS 4417 / NBRC 1672 / NRRL Y-8282 / UCD 70-5) TaxID=1071381 RepID=G8BUE4_TETPH|nr:hypothetical protein TPHA_0F02490 [Tetrapisispora phaffii CBS 4417]CCE63730.1 hypothetical protein TPHA_0F02490 [Tetrapisispora phaffii CBS 4417]
MVKLNSNKHRSKKQHWPKERTYNRALLTEEGIVIKSNNINEAYSNLKRNSVSSLGPAQDSILRRSFSNSTSAFHNSGEFSRFNDLESTHTTDETPEKILSNADLDTLETASVVSCITCLSDTHSITSPRTSGDLPYSFLNGKFPINTVIPFGRILHAKYIDRSLSRRGSDIKRKSPRSSLSKTTTGNSIQSVDSGRSTINESFKDAYEFPTSPDLKTFHSNTSFNSELKDVNFNRKYAKKLIEITFAKPRRHDIIPKRLILDIESILPLEHDLVTEILNRSYQGTRRNRKILAIINEFGGKGNAKKLYFSKAKPILAASRCKVDIVFTEYTGHAINVAKEMDINKYDTIVCASGDGIPYEIINGLYQRKDRAAAFSKLAITQLPCGSANAMSVSCHWTDNVSYAALSIVKSKEVQIDVVCCSQPSYFSTSPRLSFLSQTYGLIAESDINTEFFRWIGAARFEIGVAFNILQKKKYPCELYVKYQARNKNDLKEFYLKKHKSHQAWPNFNSYDIDPENEFTEGSSDDFQEITEENFKLKYPYQEGIPSDWERVSPELTKNLGIFYTGKMPYIAADIKFFPAALPTDGAIDMVLTDGRTAVTRMVPILLALDKGSHVLQPEVIHSKVLAYRIVPKGNNTLFSVDGEKFPNEPLQAEVLPRLCKVLLRNGSFVETAFNNM